MRGLVWYHTCMSTTQNNPAETTRTCACCGAKNTPVGADGIAICVPCDENLSSWEDAPTGYDADEDGLLYWEQHAEG